MGPCLYCNIYLKFIKYADITQCSLLSTNEHFVVFAQGCNGLLQRDSLLFSMFSDVKWVDAMLDAKQLCVII